MSKTTLVKDKEIKRTWHEIDASGKSLGRLSSEIAKLLVGKHKVTYAPHQDLGDFVVVTNAKKIKLTSRIKNLDVKKYYRFSGYSGGLRVKTLGEMASTDIEGVIRHAVRGMIDANRLRAPRLNRLKIVEGDSHNYPTGSES